MDEIVDAVVEWGSSMLVWLVPVAVAALGIAALVWAGVVLVRMFKRTADGGGTMYEPVYDDAAFEYDMAQEREWDHDAFMAYDAEAELDRHDIKPWD